MSAVESPQGPDAGIRPRMSTPVTATIAGAFGLFYAYAVWNAVGFLVSQAQGPFGLNGYGWFVLSFAVAFPILVFALAFAAGRRRRWWQFVLMLLAGLGLVAVFWLDVVGYSAVFGASMLGG
ncbi:bacitracin resistance protein [Microbacterium sp.]|uniref:bacitracin resistance protein n=1 Tax=Microbacterium sp. TaxID=51671 RepID=UPI0039E37071